MANLAYQRPELVATALNQVWSWDLTKLRGAGKWFYFHLDVPLDVPAWARCGVREALHLETEAA